MYWKPSSSDLPFQRASPIQGHFNHFNGKQGVDLELEGFPPWETIGQCGDTGHLGPVQKQLSSQRTAEHIGTLTLTVSVIRTLSVPEPGNGTCRSALLCGC